MYILSSNNRYLIALSLIPRVGRKKLAHIISSQTLLTHPNQQLLQRALNTSQYQLIVDFLNGRGELFIKLAEIQEHLIQHQIMMLNIYDDLFPFLLKQIPDPPMYLFYRGNCKVLAQRQIAIVGSRSASSSGLRHAYSMASQLSRAGFVVTSGLAIGIDAAAHSGALEEAGVSVAVMGTGLDRIYPLRNRNLAQRLLEKGCWVSEYLPGSAPIAANFPRRNRIISGLSIGVLVVEAKLKSGTLITARTALEQNREVFAVPGPIDYCGSIGCHYLISEGAKLVQSVEDIICEFDISHVSTNQQRSGAVLEPALQGVLELIDYSAMSLLELANTTGLDELELLPMLVELELQGFIENNGIAICRLN